MRIENIDPKSQKLALRVLDDKGMTIGFIWEIEGGPIDGKLIALNSRTGREIVTDKGIDFATAWCKSIEQYDH